MDTRNKILDWDEAKRLLGRLIDGGAPPTVVTGYFDPLLASHARRLEELAAGARLLVLLTPPPDPILPPRARAELVAALAAVDYVVICPDDGPAEMLNGLPTGSLFREEAADARRRDELVHHIHGRQAAAG